MSRDWVFTTYDMKWDPDTHFPMDLIHYIVWQLETCPTSGRPHFQAYLELKESKEAKWCKKNIFGPIHFEARKGPQAKAIEYCKKPESRLAPGFEIGYPHAQGARTDIYNVVEDLKNGASTDEICMAHTNTYIKFHRGIHAAAAVFLKKRQKLQRNVEVWILQGTSGSGKSHWANEIDDLFNHPGDQWWDGYCNEKNVLIDEFAGQIPYRNMLKYMDKYPCQLPVKCSHVWAQYNRLIISSKLPWREWYPNETDLSEFERRITKVLVFKDYQHVEVGVHSDTGTAPGLAECGGLPVPV